MITVKSYLFHVEKEKVLSFNAVVPSSKRSKVVRACLTSQPLINLNVAKNPLNEEMGTILLYLDDKAIQKLDELVHLYNSNRSAIIREILSLLIEQYQHSHWDKGIKKTFTLAPGTLQQLKQLIEFGERDSLIEEFLVNAYCGPTKTTAELKSRPKGGTESILVSLTQESYDKLEEFAVSIGDKVKRSHIFKDMIEQLIEELDKQNQRMLPQLQNELKSNIEELKQFKSEEEIREIIEIYLSEGN